MKIGSVVEQKYSQSSTHLSSASFFFRFMLSSNSVLILSGDESDSDFFDFLPDFRLDVASSSSFPIIPFSMSITFKISDSLDEICDCNGEKHAR